MSLGHLFLSFSVSTTKKKQQYLCFSVPALGAPRRPGVLDATHRREGPRERHRLGPPEAVGRTLLKPIKGVKCLFFLISP